MTRWMKTKIEEIRECHYTLWAHWNSWIVFKARYVLVMKDQSELII